MEGPAIETAKLARPIWGNKSYQARAREALPILVRQALAGQTIFYSDLALELGVHHRTLNFPLGSIGRTLIELSEEWGEEIPAIQCLVISRDTSLPGQGVGEFITDAGRYRALPRGEQKRLIDLELHEVYTFRRWADVLDALGLEMPRDDAGAFLAAATRYRAGGESDAHKRLKMYVAENPALVGARGRDTGTVEYQLPSGDCLDVLFRGNREWTAVEVKSRLSGVDDLARGLFQCVKYQAVLEAVRAAEGIRRSVRAVLVLESRLPSRLLGLRNRLGVEFRDGVIPQ